MQTKVDQVNLKDKINVIFVTLLQVIMLVKKSMHTIITSVNIISSLMNYIIDQSRYLYSLHVKH